jgi:lysophospholipid acyltransferase (LPLAT)-like uncharacterized protein
MLRALKTLLLLTIFRSIAPTLRLVNDPWSIIKELKKDGQKLLFCVWHEATFQCFYFYRDQKAGLLVEDSKKGEVLASGTRRYGYETFPIVDNPGDKRTIRQTIKFIKYLKEGFDGVVAVDGPNGPLRKIKPGILNIAKKTDALIIPVGVWYERKFRLRFRWDKYQMPRLFSKTVLHIKEPFTYSEDLSDQEAMQELKKTMDVMEKEAAEIGRQNAK